MTIINFFVIFIMLYITERSALILHISSDIQRWYPILGIEGPIESIQKPSRSAAGWRRCHGIGDIAMFKNERTPKFNEKWFIFTMGTMRDERHTHVVHILYIYTLQASCFQSNFDKKTIANRLASNEHQPHKKAMEKHQSFLTTLGFWH